MAVSFKEILLLFFSLSKMEDATELCTAVSPEAQTVGKPGHRQRLDAASLIDFMSRLDVVHPSLVRSIPSYKALAGFGKAFRTGCGKGEDLQKFYRNSKPVEEIDEFWSHSWHMSAWKKISCLCMLKNGCVAGALSTIAALVGGGLAAVGVLPLIRGPAAMHVCLWSQLLGTITFFPMLAWWRFQNQQIFVDCCCIDQVDPKRKAKALQSMGGILKRSRNMLMIWDPTYIERFWCVYELAAFVKSHNGSEKVRIRPALLGPFAFALICTLLVLTMAVTIFTAYDIRGLDTTILTGLVVLLVMYWAAETCRSYFHALELFKQQMPNIRLDRTSCWCCSVNHKSANGRSIPCDREIVSDCLVAWFGSLEDCEVALQALGVAGLHQLGHLLIPLKLLLACTAPMLWLCVDMAVSYYVAGDRQAATHWVVASIGYWLGSGPTTLAWLFWLARKLQKPCASPCGNRIMTFLMVAATLPVFLILFALPSFLEDLRWMPSLANVTTSTCILSLIGFITWQGAKRCSVH